MFLTCHVNVAEICFSLSVAMECRQKSEKLNEDVENDEKDVNNEAVGKETCGIQ